MSPRQSPHIGNDEIARIFARIAALMEFGEGNPFKIRSYRAASELIADLQTPLAKLAAEGGAARLRELPGIGEAISRKIVEILETGTCRLYEQLKAETPETLLDLLAIDGIGMKTAQLLYQQFHLTNLDDFARFVAGGGLESVPRLGGRAQARIIASLEAHGYPVRPPAREE
jgi:DNA polymerase (family 10)